MKNREVAYNFEQFKDAVEQKFGRQVKYTKDCKLLSDQIFAATNRQLSVSTIKRFFGLIASPFNPSRYTLDTFSFYLGYDNMESYVRSLNSNEHRVPDTDGREVIRSGFQAVTKASIVSMTGKTGYNKLRFVHRLSADDELMEFIRSENTATLFVAPKGYGKSSLLLQWYYKYFSENDRHFKNDIICLLDGGIFITLYNQPQYKEVLKPLIDLDIKAVKEFFLNSENEFKKERYMLIIDDVDKIFTGRENYYQLAGNIMQLIMVNNGNPGFKIILTCGPENIDSFTSFVIHNPLLAKAFYNVNFRYKNHTEAINVPLFNQKEIKEALARNISSPSYFFLSFYYPDTFELIKIPSFFSFFVQKEESSENEFSLIHFLNQVIQHFIYSHPFAEEKQLLVKKFLQLCNMEEDVPSAGKELLLEGDEIRFAYQELINAGVIYECIDSSDSPGLHLRVKFSNVIIFEYMLARMLTKNNNLDTAFLSAVFVKYRNAISTQYALLKWLIKLAFHEGNNDLLKQVHQMMERTVNVQNEISGESMPGSLRSVQAAFSQGLRTYKKSSEILMPWLAKSRLGQKLYFGEYFDMDNLMFFPESSLDVFADAVATPETSLISGYIRFAKGFYSLDHNVCSTEFEKIKHINISDINNSFLLGYYFSIYFLYASLIKGDGKKEMLKKVLSGSGKLKLKTPQSFRFVPPFEFFVVYNLNTCNFYDEILILGDYSGNIEAPTQMYSSGFYQFYQLCYARALLHTGSHSQAMDLYQQVEIGEFPPHIRHFMQLNVNLAKVDFLEHQHKTAEALQLLYETKELATQMDYVYYQQKAADIESKFLNAKKDIPG